MIEVLPAILPVSEFDLEEKVNLVRDYAPIIHLDVLEKDIWTDIHHDFEAHLMVKNPDAILDLWVDRGAKRIIIHKLTDKAFELRNVVEIGLALEFHIPIEDVLPHAHRADFVQLMAISKIGGQGQAFERGIFDRIEELGKSFPEVIISVDGGVRIDNADDLILAGVDRLVVGSAIFASEEPLETLERFLEIAQ